MINLDSAVEQSRWCENLQKIALESSWCNWLQVSSRWYHGHNFDIGNKFPISEIRACSQSIMAFHHNCFCGLRKTVYGTATHLIVRSKEIWLKKSGGSGFAFHLRGKWFRTRFSECWKKRVLKYRSAWVKIEHGEERACSVFATALRVLQCAFMQDLQPAKFFEKSKYEIGHE